MSFDCEFKEMFVYLGLLLICPVISPAVSSVARERVNSCSTGEFTCRDGSCVSLSSLCDGDSDCFDGSDELACSGISMNGLSDSILHRTRRQASQCRRDQWRCRDGTCISFDGKCDGAVDCPDRSDETHALCRNNKCQPNWFRCTYGACVDGTAPCNNMIECADQSDELLPRCRNETDEFQNGLSDSILHRTRRQASQCRRDQWRCRDGTCISFDGKCDGAVDCPDRSDETHALCRNNKCQPNWFRCTYGACVDGSAPCNNMIECADQSDELLPRCRNETDEFQNGLSDSILHRTRRQASQCRRDQWLCRDGTCISFDGKCDGAVDCPDRSDETHALCRNTKCQPNWFRCTYGACVDGTAPCNNMIECADQSDELLPRCRNETDEFQGQFRCLDGSAIPASNRCDGNPDCPDGSDETVRACASKTCPSYLFQCAYGACVDQGSDCNGKQECADGSDESDELCNRQLPTNPSVTTRPTESGNCILPPYPEHGTYVSNKPYATPGQGFKSLYLNVTCRPGYGVLDTSIVFCQDGTWSASIPKCVHFCKLDNNPSVRYHCLVTGSVEGRRDCNPYEPAGTVVRPECNSPNYYSSVPLPFMRCIEGSWDYVAVCTPECGRVTPDGVDLIIDGRPAKRGELPWHVGIYRKTTKPYMQICGGSLVTNRVVVSAAHCFWNDVRKQQPASMYAVAVGKIYRPWNNERDVDAQKSDVKEIKIPIRFQGSAANFQDDIAIVILETAFVYQTYVRPVCLDFDINFDRRQLQPGKLGKVAGWGLTAENGAASQILKVVELPYVDIEQCFAASPLGFIEYITSDKICAGYGNGTALCKGDSGGGLAFPESERGTDRYYLRGIVSTAANNENLCNSNTLTTFTQIIKHDHFVKEYL